MILVIGAMQVEIDGLVEKFKNKRTIKHKSFKFIKGKIDKAKVVACCCGIGKVSAAVATATGLLLFKKAQAVINLGVAGGLDSGLNQLDFAIAGSAVQHDFDLTVEGLKKGQQREGREREYKSSQKLVDKMEKAVQSFGYNYKIGTIVSGDQFICCDKTAANLATEFSAIACDMESAAIAQACEVLDIPFVSIRSISDNANSKAELDFPAFMQRAAKRSIEVVTQFLQGQGYGLELEKCKM